MPVKLATKVQAKTAKICRGRQLKKLIAVNDDINHKKMKPGAMTISTKRQMKSQLEASAVEADALEKYGDDWKNSRNLCKIKILCICIS